MRCLAFMIAVAVGLACWIQSDAPAIDAPQRSSFFIWSFAHQLARCTEPGPKTHQFVNRFRHHRDPTKKIIAIYQESRKRWHYVHDHRQEHQSCEYSVENLAGDCEDFACLMGAILKATEGIESRLVLSKSDQGEGHAYCEVLIAENLQDSGPILRELAQALGIVEIYYSQDSDERVWVALDFEPPTRAPRPATIYVYLGGRFETVQCPATAIRLSVKPVGSP